MTNRPRLPAAGAVATALAALLCGCSGGGGADSAVPALGPVPTITDPSQVTLPTDAFPPTAEQLRGQRQVVAAVSAACTRDLGYGDGDRTTHLIGVEQEVRSRVTRSFSYGYFAPAGTQPKGYGTHVDMDEVMAAAGPAQPLSAEEETALNGRDPATGQPVERPNGREVPEGGCHRKGREAIADVSSGLPDGGPAVPLTDPRTVEAYSTWSACMQAEGYDYKDPSAAIADERRRQPSERQASDRQIATATADVECKITNNTVGVIVAVQRAYGTRYVEAHAEALAALRQKSDELLASVATADPAGTTG